MGHGGQTRIDYHGSGGVEDEADESNANSAAGTD
jgi:hypothetical protein